MQINKAGKREKKAEFFDSERNAEHPVLNEILNALRRIKFGEVVITIHEGRVVQIEKREKERFK